MRIELDQLSKRYDRDWIVKQFSYEFQAGHCYGISGRNGTGKSTLLRILSGHLSPSRGRITYLHQDQQLASDEIYPLVSYVAPYIELVEELSLAELLKFHFKFKDVRLGLSLDELPDRMELGYARRQVLSKFSSGMKQRVMLGLALYAATPLLLLDEPTITLDQEGRAWFHKQLKEQRGPDRLVVIATNVEEDLAPCDTQIDMEIVRGNS